jgi:hypothetical protein
MPHCIGSRRLIPGQHRNEYLGKRPFGKQATHEVGYFERHEKGIGQGIRPELAGNQQIADKTQDAGEQRGTADQGGRFK